MKLTDKLVTTVLAKLKTVSCISRDEIIKIGDEDGPALFYFLQSNNLITPHGWDWKLSEKAKFEI